MNVTSIRLLNDIYDNLFAVVDKPSIASGQSDNLLGTGTISYSEHPDLSSSWPPSSLVDATYKSSK
jgi:hypothetical protein